MSTTGANNPVVGGSKVEQGKKKVESIPSVRKGWQVGRWQQGGTGKKESGKHSIQNVAGEPELTSARKSELRPKEARADGETSE